MKFLIAPDSFKGSLTANEAAGFMREGISKALPDARFACLPMADGGEGTIDAILRGMDAEAVSRTVEGPLGDPVDAKFAILKSGEAVIEMAQASGLLLVPEDKRDVMSASTYGTGQLMLHALDLGCRKLFIGIGGSATNDGGVGMAEALGIRFYDSEGKPLKRGGGSLGDLAHIDYSGLDPRITETEITVLCDVNNPLCGPLGASYVYGPQKGATAATIAVLDKNLAHLADVVEASSGIDAKDVPGSGAAGGIGFGLICFTGAKMMQGIDAILAISDFDEEIKTADVVVTGEGKLDPQSMRGKVIFGVLARAEKAGVPAIAICGRVTDAGRQAFAKRFLAIVPCAPEGIPLDLAMKNAGSLLASASEQIATRLFVKDK